MFSPHAFIFSLFSTGFFLSALKLLKTPIESGVGWAETTVSQLYILLKPSHSLLPFLETSRKNILVDSYLFTSHSLLRSLSGWVLTHQPNQTACAEVLPLPWPPNSGPPCSPLLRLQSLSFLGFSDTRLFWFPLPSLTANLLSPLWPYLFFSSQ